MFFHNSPRKDSKDLSLVREENQRRVKKKGRKRENVKMGQKKGQEMRMQKN